MINYSMIKLPQYFINRLKSFAEIIEADPQHVLEPGIRQEIYLFFGEPNKRSNALSNVGHRRRTFLAIECARYVAPIWEQRWPGDKTARRAIECATKLLQVTDSAAAYETLDSCAVRVENAALEDFVLSKAGQSAVLALSTALEDEFLSNYPTEDWIDEQRGSGDEDAASSASMAYSNGSVLHENSDPDKRYEFWRWWLLQAVPESYIKGTI